MDEPSLLPPLLPRQAATAQVPSCAKIVEKLTPELLSAATTSTVNLAEVYSKLVSRGLPPHDAWEATLGPISEAVPFTSEHARLAGDLVAKTRTLGLSLGDRACLALGLTLKAPIYTADRSWNKVRVGARIHVIR